MHLATRTHSRCEIYGSVLCSYLVLKLPKTHAVRSYFLVVMHGIELLVKSRHFDIRFTLPMVASDIGFLIQARQQAFDLKLDLACLLSSNHEELNVRLSGM